MKPFFEHISADEQHPSFSLMEVEVVKGGSNWHYHPQLELTYVLRGSGMRMVGDHVGRFKPGDLMLTGENLPHDFNLQEQGHSALFLVVQFLPQVVSPFPEFRNIELLFNRAQKGLLFPDLDSHLVTHLQDFANLTVPLQVINLLHILHELSQHSRAGTLCSDNFTLSPAGEQQTSRMNRVVDFVGNHFARPIQLQELAEYCAMTQPSFCRWFKNRMGCTFTTYLNRYRVEQAAKWLVESEQAVGIIASQSGFESLSSFNRAFKRCKGISPTQFRKRWRRSA